MAWFFCCSLAHALDITEGTYEGRPQFIVRTEAATWFYDPAGGGFSRLIDRCGRDWIAFSKSPLNQFPQSAAAGYRGLPNLVFGRDNPDAGAGHPGFDLCESEIVGRDRIRTRSRSGEWSWSWVFTETNATFTMDKADPEHPWWFLYEGPIAGSFSPANKYWGADRGGPRRETPDNRNPLFDRWQWVYFGDLSVPRVLLLAQHEPDDLPDTLWYLGSSEGGAATAPDGMVVFGFGRGPGTRPQLRGAGQRFTVGLLEMSVTDAVQHAQLGEKIEAASRSAGSTCWAALHTRRVPLHSGPRPGDVFREYLWTNTGGDADGSVRVGGRLDYGGGPIELPGEFDLSHALRAEIVVEKLLCHEGTRGLEISVNDNEWIEIPESAGIPQPQWQYMHHIYPIVPAPLEQLKAGGGNQVRLRVSDEHPWKWPQNLVYGVHIRIYYDPAKKPHPTGRLISPHPGTALGTSVPLAVEASSPNGPIRQVDFLGHHEDVNLEGDGEYRQWHYHFHRSVLTGHIGSTMSAPWRLTWDTSWIPDQPQPFQLAARITDESGLTYFTTAVDDLTFARDGLTVELCRPYDVPKQWLTRKGEHSQKFRVTGNLEHAVASRLVWVSWCPGYMEGLYVNEQLVLEREGPRYAHFVHRVELPDLTMLQPGENILKTGMTPKYDGKMVHGMEVNWPGIMVLIQYRKPRDPTTR